MKKSYKNHCYMVIDVETDLPLGVFDTYAEAMDFIGCSSRTFYRLLDGASYMGMTVEKILL